MAAKRKPASRARPTRVRRPAAKRPATRKAPVRAAAAKSAAKAKPLRIAGVGSEAVLKATGRAWDEWLKVLDRAGARSMPHKEIALMLSRKFSVPDWWSQMVTVGYEQARGLRKPRQKSDGYSASASRTVAASIDKLFDAWSEVRQRARWLPDAPLEVRRSTDGKSMGMTWTTGGSNVEVRFSARGAAKSTVAVEHAKLPDSGAATRQKAYWGSALERLKALLEA
jgi:uncharacterized protein YndB with AHSA1/START domain